MSLQLSYILFKKVTPEDDIQLHTTNLDIQVRTFRQIYLKCQYSMLTGHCSEHHGCLEPDFSDLEPQDFCLLIYTLFAISLTTQAKFVFYDIKRVLRKFPLELHLPHTDSGRLRILRIYRKVSVIGTYPIRIMHL